MRFNPAAFHSLTNRPRSTFRLPWPYYVGQAGSDVNANIVRRTTKFFCTLTRTCSMSRLQGADHVSEYRRRLAALHRS